MDTLTAAGITPVMHAERLSPSSPFRAAHTEMSAPEFSEVLAHNSAVLAVGELETVTWPLDERIEYQLGQILPGLKNPLPPLTPRAFARIREQLLELASKPSTYVERPRGNDPHRIPHRIPRRDDPTGLMEFTRKTQEGLDRMIADGRARRPSVPPQPVRTIEGINAMYTGILRGLLVFFVLLGVAVVVGVVFLARS